MEKMIKQEKMEKGQGLYHQLLEKAWKDTKFRDKLVTNPQETLEDFTGKDISKNIKIIVEDQTDTSTIYLNIPRKLRLEDLELSEKELELISGGDCGCGPGGNPFAIAGYYTAKALHDFDMWLGKVVFG